MWWWRRCGDWRGTIAIHLGRGGGVEGSRGGSGGYRGGV